MDISIEELESSAMEEAAARIQSGEDSFFMVTEQDGSCDQSYLLRAMAEAAGAAPLKNARPGLAVFRCDDPPDIDFSDEYNMAPMAAIAFLDEIPNVYVPTNFSNVAAKGYGRPGYPYFGTNPPSLYAAVMRVNNFKAVYCVDELDVVIKVSTE